MASGQAAPTFQFRTGALIAGSAIVFVFLALLVRAIRPVLQNSGDTTTIGFASIVRTVKPPPPLFEKPPRRASGIAPVTSAPAPASTLDANLLFSLGCFDLSAEERRKRKCPPVAPIERPAPWARGPLIPKPPLTREELFTPAENATTHARIALCGSAAVGGARICVGPPPPPPPPKTPVEYCEAANMGGPCRPPPQERVVPE